MEISGGFTKDALTKSKIYPSFICSVRAKANSVLCVQCGKWIHIRCTVVKRAYPKRSRNFASRKCKGNIGETQEQKVKLCNEVKTVRELTYLRDGVRADGGCEAAVTTTTCG